MKAKKIVIPEWENIQMGDMNENDLYRHFMFLGETGSGKSVSGVLPICRLAFDNQYQSDRLSSAGLVVDPKGELGEHIAGMLGDEADQRLIRIRNGINSQVLWKFDGSSLDGRDGTSIMEELMVFSESYQGQKSSSRDKFWINSSSQLISAIIDIDLALYRHANGKGVKNIENFWQQFYMLLEISSSQDDRAANIVPIYEMLKNKNILSEILGKISKLLGITVASDIAYKKENYLNHFINLMAASCSYWCEDSKAARMRAQYKISSGTEKFQLFWGIFIAFIDSFKIDGQKVFDYQSVFFKPYTQMSSETYSSLYAVFSSLIYEFTDREFYTRISINPFEPPDNKLSIDKIINNGMIIVYEPGIVNSVTTTVGKVIKALFFIRLLVPERLNNDSIRPFFYICDEFQRFITHDNESGEQSFLDRCRAYRVCCALATQSLASLRYAFPDEQGTQAINILVTNTGTKMFFRTTDRATFDTLLHLIPEPHRQDRPHVVQVRPPSTLQPGECYYALVNGKSGRGQIISMC